MVNRLKFYVHITMAISAIFIKGEELTSKNVRYCVNSIALDFIPKDAALNPLVVPTEITIFPGGCFWGVEYLMQQQPEVLAATSGYMGGIVPNPIYSIVCHQKIGHAEVVQVIFDPKKLLIKRSQSIFLKFIIPPKVMSKVLIWANNIV